MGHRLVELLAGIMLVAPLAAAPAQQDDPACAGAATLPAPLAAWPSRRPIAAAGDAAGLASASLAIGQPVAATLRATTAMHYVTRPEKQGGAGSYGGLFAFTVAAPGTYRVALGSGAWIDVLKGKAAIVSTAHSHGPACSGVRKMVDFILAPGRYTLQIAGNDTPALPLMIARVLP